jgi:RNA polymerase sigma factor (sigma-70 family)
MYTKEELITIHVMIDQMLQTHFGDRTKPGDREEIRQEILEKIISKKLRHNEDKGTLGNWLYRVVQNHITDIYRIKRREILVHMESISHFGFMEDEEEQLKEELFADRWTQFNHLLSKEKDIDQRIVHLRHEHEMSYEQIAEHLALPVGPLAMRYKRTKERLKKNYRPNRLADN